jgi:hypothetical protein
MGFVGRGSRAGLVNINSKEGEALNKNPGNYSGAFNHVSNTMKNTNLVTKIRILIYFQPLQLS